MKRTILRHSIALALALTAGLVAAQSPATYPAGPVKLIVGFAPGGGVDLNARFLAKKLGEKLGHSFVVENRAGASGNIGAAAVAKSRPDGQTLLFTSVVHSVNPNLFPTLPFDPVKDFAPVTTFGLSPVAFAAHPGAPFRTLPEMVAYAKSHPGRVSYSSAGPGTMMAMGMALFESMAGVKLLHIPYNGTGPSVQGAVSGHVQVVSSGYGAVESFTRSGQLRMLGIATARPSELAPGVPTIAEGANVPGFEVVSWQGIFAPAGTPPAVIAKLYEAVGEIQKETDTREFMVRQGVQAYYLPSAKFAELVRTDIAKFNRIVKDSGLKLE